MEKNPQARSVAFRKAQGKILKIKELGITPDMSEEDINALIERLSEAKAANTPGTTMEDHVANQRWYVEGLVKFSGYDVKKQFETEYENAFADTASEPEMLKALEAL